MHYRDLVRAVNMNYGISSKHFPKRPINIKGTDPSYWRAMKNPLNLVSVNKFLRDWKMARVLRHNSSWKHQVGNAIKTYKNHLYTLERKSLLETDVKKIREPLMGLFDLVRKAVGPTSTSKIIHLHLPDLCVMWDRAIREKYGYSDNCQGFYNFTLRMKEELSEAMNTYLKDYPIEKSSNAVSHFIGRLTDPPLPITRILDIYNYHIVRDI
ncbi:MAG: hypothetical protein HY619_06765 [Thaumarchaeota archaeon]|nr:hypothetical protein [Nitrososphaerota archaeon]